MLVLTVK